MLSLEELAKKIREETPKLKTQAQIEAEEKVRKEEEERKRVHDEKIKRQYEEQQRIWEEQKPERVANNITELDLFIRKAAKTGKLRHELPKKDVRYGFNYKEGINKAFLERHGYVINEYTSRDIDGDVCLSPVYLTITKDGIDYQKLMITSKEAFELGIEARINLNKELREKIIAVLNSPCVLKGDDTNVVRTYEYNNINFKEEAEWGEKPGHVLDEIREELNLLIPGAKLNTGLQHYIRNAGQLILVVPKEKAE